ncbi:MAG: heme biosynthesis protein HemY [Burkholderiaceae bacterium]
MRFFLWMLVLLATAIGLALTARFNPGNVVFFYPPYRVDLSLNFFLLLAILAFVLMYLVIDAVVIARNMPRKVASYRRMKRESEGNQALRDALKALFEGRFGHAEKAAAHASTSPDSAALAALVAARAAHWLRQFERRDSWLARAATSPALKSARLMTTLELLVDEHQPVRALAAVEELNSTGTRHIHALRLALKANQQADNWPAVLHITRVLDKNNAIHPTLSRRLRELAYADILSNKPHDIESMRNLWGTIPADDRLRAYVAARAAAAFNAVGSPDDARAIVEKALTVEWDDQLIQAYRRCAAAGGTSTLLAQIERCENWCRARPHDAQLTLTLGALCLKQKLWGKAQRSLEQVLNQPAEGPIRREAHLVLAELYEAVGDAVQAAAHYRESARLI